MNKIRAIFYYPDSFYNCSGKTVEEWMATGERWPILGNMLMSFGVLYLALYLPAIYAILKLRLTKNPCYQIMLSIAFADMINIIANSIFGGYLFSVGAVFCMSPVFMYIEGAFNMCAWGFASVLYVVLALNRFVVITGWIRVTHYVTRVPIYVWLFLAASWSFYTGILHKPLTYNSKELGKYENRMHALNNVLFSVLICFFYSVISLILLVGTHRKQISKKEINALIQAALITCPAMIGSLLYVYIQFTNKATKGWAILGQFMWQTITDETLPGTGAIIYLTLNQSVRDYYFHRSRVHGYQTTTSDSNQGKLQPSEQTGTQKC